MHWLCGLHNRAKLFNPATTEDDALPSNGSRPLCMVPSSIKLFYGHRTNQRTFMNTRGLQLQCADQWMTPFWSWQLQKQINLKENFKHRYKKVAIRKTHII